jgi:alcohol dehydrogenase class IV
MSDNTIARYSFPTDIRFGMGARALLPDILKTAGVTRPLIVTDAGLARLPILGEIQQLLATGKLDAAVFSGVIGNPVLSQVSAGVTAFRAHKADGIVGLGGGAALDVAKAIALMVNHPGDLFDYEDDLPGGRPFDQPIPYIVALPTTAGTGSEVGRSAVISDDTSHIKKIIFSPRLLAKVVLADPELTVGLPAPITAATGMDALTHNVEAFLARGNHPICDGIALEGVRLSAMYLERAVKNGADLEARGGMLMSSMMGAIAFQKGLGVVHSCAHALGTVCDTHHGLANGVMIDHALAFNVEVSEARFNRLCDTINIGNPSPGAFLDWLRRLKADVMIPAGLTGLGISAESIPRLADVAVADACHANNPRPCARENFERIFQSAL